MSSPLRPSHAYLGAILALSCLAPALAADTFYPDSVYGQPGFFRVGKTRGGRWWLIDPDGRPFAHRGITSCHTGVPIGNPPPPVTDTVRVRDSIFTYLRNWGFTALGAWTFSTMQDRGFPYSTILYFNGFGPTLSAQDNRPDVFNPAWERAADSVCSVWVDPLRGSKDLIGWFTTNEMNWSPPEVAKVPGAHNSSEALSIYAETFFRKTSEILRRHDPNHLILGCRFAGDGPPAEVWPAVRRPYVDVVSENVYRDTAYGMVDKYYRKTGLPQLVTEFAWAAEGYFYRKPVAGEPQGDSVAVRVYRMTTVGKAALRQAATHPALVGWTWFKWMDGTGQVPPLSFGLISQQGAINHAHVDALAELNREFDTLPKPQALGAGDAIRSVAWARSPAASPGLADLLGRRLSPKARRAISPVFPLLSAPTDGSTRP